MDAKAEKLALFRYGLIAPLVLEPLPRGELTRRAAEIAGRQYEIPDSTRRAVSVDTLLDWAARYRRGGFAGLAPKPRQDRGQSRTITPQLATLIDRLKRENPHRTGTAFAAPVLAWVVWVPFAFATEFIQRGFFSGLWHGFLLASFGGFLIAFVEGLILVSFAILGRIAAAALHHDEGTTVILPPRAG